MARILLLVLCLYCLPGVAHAQETRTRYRPTHRQRVHLKDVAIRLSHVNNSYDLAKLTNSFEKSLYGGKAPTLSRFERSLKRGWDPKPFYRAGRGHPEATSTNPAARPVAMAIHQFWQPSLFAGTAKKPARRALPRRFPWAGKTLRWNKRNPLQDLIFDKNDHFKGTVINTLARYADGDGWINADTLQRLLGSTPMERSLHKMITTPQKGVPKILTWNHLLEYLDTKALKKTLAPEMGKLVPKMPALKWVSRQFNTDGKKLAGFRVIGHQHILGNTLGFLEEAGITPRRTNLWGKVYSQDPRVSFAMMERGYRMHGVFSKGDRRALEKRLQRTLSKIPHPEKIKKPIFMLLDDGGEVIETVANYVRQNFPNHARLFTGVEQTTRGITRLKKIDLPFSVVGVGASWGKTTYGSPMIGYALFKEADASFKSHAKILLGDQGKRPYQATVVGYGNVGRWVAKYLKQAGYDVLVHDKDPAKRKEARAAGFATQSRKSRALQHAQLLVSCVGKPHMKQKSFWHLPNNAMVVNGASLDELPRNGLAAGGLPKLTEARYEKSLSKDIVHIFSRKRADGTAEKKFISFPRYGGVMNFPLSVTHPRAGGLIPGRYIQFDLGLLYLGLLQAAEGGKPGLQDLRRAPQRKLRDRVEAELGARGESLMNPGNWF